jgi:hypothetical protein
MALQYTPADPVPGDTVSLSITGATGQTEATRFALTSVPDQSAMSARMLVDEGGNAVQEFTPDVAGAYGVTAYDYRRFIGIPRYVGDPAGESHERLVATQTGTVYVGNASKLTISALGSSIDLRLVIAGSTVRSASLVNPTTEIARLAALDSTVSAAVDALVGVAVGSLGEDIISDVASMIAKFNMHTANSSVHDEVYDPKNYMIEARIETLPGTISALNTFYDKVLAHMTEDGGWHETPDRMHLPVAKKASDRASATVLLADLRSRIYSRHIATLGTDNVDQVHHETNTDHQLSADSPLTAAIVAVLDYFEAQTPATPTGENPGHAGSMGYGFTPES